MCREWQQLRRSTTMRQWLHDAKSFAWLETFSGVEMIAKYLDENANLEIFINFLAAWQRDVLRYNNFITNLKRN